jgi:TetR/AcrR family transcriptional regulator, transcriptional repressor for nem operon
MARPREFDEAKALEKAIQCFWERGYEATSMRDLETKMGISAPSLYNTYGDKHALFAQALERYLDRSARALIKRFEDSLPPKQAIRRFIREIIKSIKAAQAEGAIPRNRAAKDLARLLLGVLLGIRVLARSKPERALLEGIARPALALLD